MNQEMNNIQWQGVVKVQRPLTGEQNQVLVYNKEKFLDFEMECDEEFIDSVFDIDEYLNFWNVILHQDGTMELVAKAQEQDW